MMVVEPRLQDWQLLRKYDRERDSSRGAKIKTWWFQRLGTVASVFKILNT